ncbi:uncharacterized protein LOC129104682 [Anoplopoma fimbria]|uniref:uncharacterized protein LOC129104682 n=1 Tax=Anoplopoma fimbria TaxID=229290 RepID=UPI0023EC38E9|nr:uncharacterized protein LOC129104682 [Anoplopoma fimbria]XP_054471470.1 uncharacterized protein LOC129104682 [Anoplopoma fimbria]
MSTSDSDYSIDWLASDEDDDYDESSPKRLSPRSAEESPLTPPSSPPSSSSPSLRESPTSCFHSQRRKRRRSCCDSKDGGLRRVDADSPADPQASAVVPVQGFTSVSEQLSEESKHHSDRKRLCGKTPPDTEHELFSQKCGELQRYIPPLSSILRGLRSGRYSERLSSFQESVAMDRIQRIMGVLQNPNMGGRFLSILLKIEGMLQSWFPHIRPDPTEDGSPAKPQKHHGAASSLPPSSAASLSSSRRLHPSPTCFPKSPDPTPGRPTATTSTSTSPPPALCSQDVTQDSAVSSSTDSRSGPPPRRLGRAPFKIRSPCLERLLRAKQSIVSPRTAGDGGWSS